MWTKELLDSHRKTYEEMLLEERCEKSFNYIMDRLSLLNRSPEEYCKLIDRENEATFNSLQMAFDRQTFTTFSIN